MHVPSFQCAGTLQALSGRRLQQPHDGQLKSTYSGTQWFLAADDGQRWALDFQGTPDAPAGSRVEVTVRQKSLGRLLLDGPPRQLEEAGKQRSLLQTSSGTAPKGYVTFAIFIMDLSPCGGRAGPATTPQVRTNPDVELGMWSEWFRGTPM